MKIQSATSSKVFDEYAKNMKNFLEKKAIAWYKQLLDGLTTGKPFQELLESSGKSLKEFVLESQKNGKNANEIAELTGKNVSEINNLLKSIPDAANVAQIAMETAQETAKISQVISENYNIVKKDSMSLAELSDTIRNIKDLEGKSLKEISDLYQHLRKSRNTLKNNASKLREALREAEEKAVFSAKELNEQKELVRGAETLLNRSADEQLALSTKIMELGGKLDSAGNVIKGLEEQLTQHKNVLSDITDELELSNKVIEDLKLNGIQLSEENNLLIHEAVKQAQLAEFYKNMALAAKAELDAVGESITPAVKTIEEVAQEATEKSVKAANKVTNNVPESKNIIDEATEVAKKNGKEKAEKNVKKIKTEAEEEVKDEMKSKGIPLDKNSFSFILRKKIKEKLAAGLISTLSFGSKNIIKFIALLGLGVLAYKAWKYFSNKNPEVSKNHIGLNQESQRGLIILLKKLKFKENSQGDLKTKNLISALEKSFQSLTALSSNMQDESLFNKALKDLSDVETLIEDYEKNKDAIQTDLLLPDGFNEVFLSIDDLKKNNELLKKDIAEQLNQNNLTTSDVGMNRGITDPVGRTTDIPVTTTSDPQKQEYIPEILDMNIIGEKISIDVGKESAGFRSVAPRLINEILKSPEGLAFIDPKGIWGGWLPKTTKTNEDGTIEQDKSKDYLRALEYMYLNKIFSRQDLRKFIRDNLPKVGRKRMSGWNNAIKYYSSLNNLDKKQSNNKNIFENKLKSTNYSTFGMKKKADDISKDYYQVALTGLDDQYARSYYTGLKSMYDEKPSKTEADFKKLYEVHDETGSDLIGQAHPLTINLADAMGNGGVVENLIEQQRHNQNVALSVPTGNFRGKHAWIVKELVKLADQADNSGLEKTSDLIDEAIAELIDLK